MTEELIMNKIDPVRKYRKLSEIIEGSNITDYLYRLKWDEI